MIQVVRSFPVKLNNFLASIRLDFLLSKRVDLCRRVVGFGGVSCNGNGFDGELVSFVVVLLDELWPFRSVRGYMVCHGQVVSVYGFEILDSERKQGNF